MQLDSEQKRIWTENNLEHLRYEYDLNENSVVFDIGACEGTFLKQIRDKFNCRIFAYEPLKEHYLSISKLRNDKIKVYKNAVSHYNGVMVMSKTSESEFTNNGETENVVAIDINQIIKSDIDLMKINIEGGEYTLLKSITEDNLKKIKNIQVQFHILDDNSKQDRLNIHKKLSKTHELTWEYPFCWENWRLK